MFTGRRWIDNVHRTLIIVIRTSFSLTLSPMSTRRYMKTLLKQLIKQNGHEMTHDMLTYHL